MSATRSDGTSIASVLERTAPVRESEARKNRQAGYYECRDPECPEWAKYVEKHDAFWSHYHKVAR